jgi:hypothetical protein
MSGTATTVGVADQRAMLSALSDIDPGLDDPARVDQIRLLEELKSAAAAAQARVTAAFVKYQRAEQAAAGVKPERIGRGIAGQIALAKRCSPAFAQRYIGFAMILTRELPATFAALAAGQTSEWRALLVARETAWLSRADRAAVDAEIGPQLARLGDRKVESETKRLAYRYDPSGYVGRLRRVQADRHVGIRPVPDTMTRLSALLTIPQGVAAHTALCRAADQIKAAGDPRSRGQIMADTLVERVTGLAAADDVPVEINLVMTDQALLQIGPHRDEPAHVAGYGPVPAEVARELVHRSGRAVPRWIRRLYARPHTGELAAVESRRRLFTPGQRRFVELRDQTCRTPYCDAPIRHVDHVQPYHAGGPTAVDNAAGLCETCNYAKEAPGWHSRMLPDGVLEVTTPTGHQYRSRAPSLPGAPRRWPQHRPADLVFYLPHAA